MPRTKNFDYQPNLLPRSFYERNTVEVAKDLLGMFLVRIYSGKRLVGRMCEVEAYRGPDDPASHAYRGPTDRNRVMFGPPGHAYVYFIYGNHWCLNVVTEPEGVPGAVLVRGVEPISGITEMERNRGTGTTHKRQLTNGPGKLAHAFRISGHLNGSDLTRQGPLFLCTPAEPKPFQVTCSSRIGIRSGYDKSWRFFITRSPYVSGRTTQ